MISCNNIKYFVILIKFLEFYLAKECKLIINIFYDDRLALLWFHTIVRPFFGLDGSNSRSGADAAQRLIDGAKPEFAEASLFLFFQGRVNRLKVYGSK